jgi:hypothetical protein
MVSCTQKYSTSQYVPIQIMINNVYLSIYFNIQGISLHILAYQMDNIWQGGDIGVNFRQAHEVVFERKPQDFPP